MALQPSPLLVPFVNLSTVQQQSYYQRTNMSNAWVTFQRVELYNSNVSTIYSANSNATLTYYQFFNNTEKSLYSQGQNLFYYYLSYSTQVEKN